MSLNNDHYMSLNSTTEMDSRQPCKLNAVVLLITILSCGLILTTVMWGYALSNISSIKNTNVSNVLIFYPEHNRTTGNSTTIGTNDDFIIISDYKIAIIEDQGKDKDVYIIKYTGNISVGFYDNLYYIMDDLIFDKTPILNKEHGIFNMLSIVMTIVTFFICMLLSYCKKIN